MRKHNTTCLEIFALSIFVTFLFSILLFIQWEVNEIVPHPYMDEQFHVGQTKKYCQGHWTEWDQNITTFPGLYVVAVGYVRLLDILKNFFGFSQWSSSLCEVAGLRTLNTILTPFIWLITYFISKTLKLIDVRRVNTNSFLDNFLTASLVTFFPVSFFFTFLFYTDNLSVLLVLLMIYFVLSLHSSTQTKLRRYTLLSLSALSGGFSVFVRQTNVIWVVFTFGMSVIFDFHRYNTIGMQKKSNNSSQLQIQSDQKHEKNNSFTSSEHELFSFLRYIFFHRFEIFKYYFLFFVIFVCFGMFVIWNGSITVGDKEAHTATLHIPQFLYCISFIGFWDFDHWCELANYIFHFFNTRQQIKRSISIRKSALFTVTLVLIFILLEVAVYRFTYAHRYLISDNRHYTFYIWRRLFVAYPNAKYLAVPIYLLLFFSLWQHLQRVQSVVLGLLYFGCVAVVLIPAPLLEFRYFITPFQVFLLYSHSKAQLRDEVCGSRLRYFRIVIWTLNLMFFLFVNIVTLYIFLYRPFKAANGEVGRFMW